MLDLLIRSVAQLSDMSAAGDRMSEIGARLEEQGIPTNAVSRALAAAGSDPWSRSWQMVSLEVGRGKGEAALKMLPRLIEGCPDPTAFALLLSQVMSAIDPARLQHREVSRGISEFLAALGGASLDRTAWSALVAVCPPEIVWPAPMIEALKRLPELPMEELTPPQQVIQLLIDSRLGRAEILAEKIREIGRSLVRSRSPEAADCRALTLVGMLGEMRITLPPLRCGACSSGGIEAAESWGPSPPRSGRP